MLLRFARRRKTSLSSRQGHTRAFLHNFAALHSSGHLLCVRTVRMAGQASQAHFDRRFWKVVRLFFCISLLPFLRHPDRTSILSL